MLPIQSEIHGLLQFQTGVPVVHVPALGLDFGLHFIRLVQILERNAVAVFPIVATVIDTFERQFVVGIDIVIQRQRVALTLTGHIVLARLSIGQEHFAGFLVAVVFKFHIVRTDRRVLVRSSHHDTELVLEETVAIGQAQVQLRLVADHIVTASHRGGKRPAVRRALGNQINRPPDGIPVHIRSHHLVHLDSLNHVRRNQVQLHVTDVTFGRRQTVPVNRHRTHIGRRTPHLAETGFALVVLHIDPADPFQSIPYIGIWELADLVR